MVLTILLAKHYLCRTTSHEVMFPHVAMAELEYAVVTGLSMRCPKQLNLLNGCMRCECALLALCGAFHKRPRALSSCGGFESQSRRICWGSSRPVIIFAAGSEGDSWRFGWSMPRPPHPPHRTYRWQASLKFWVGAAVPTIRGNGIQSPPVRPPRVAPPGIADIGNRRRIELTN